MTSGEDEGFALHERSHKSINERSTLFSNCRNVKSDSKIIRSALQCHVIHTLYSFFIPLLASRLLYKVMSAVECIQ